MNKKALIITIVSLVVATICIGIVFYLQSFKTIHFDIKKNGVEVTIFKGESKLQTFNADTDVRLQSGDYIFTTTGKDYDNTPISFTVADRDTTISVDPPYSDAYQERVLTSEITAITAALITAYPIVETGFTMDRGKIYQDGTWYATTLIQIPSHPREPSDTYRVVLKKESGIWKVQTKPALVLSEREYPDIPFDILTDINKKQQ